MVLWRLSENMYSFCFLWSGTKDSPSCSKGTRQWSKLYTPSQAVVTSLYSENVSIGRQNDNPSINQRFFILTRC